MLLIIGIFFGGGRAWWGKRNHQGQTEPRSSSASDSVKGMSSSGSNQAREGRLVDALAVRGDEGRDTLR